MRFLFIGWESDYQRIEIEEISKKENVRHVVIPRTIKKFTRIFKIFSRQLYHNVNSLYLMITAISKGDIIILQDGAKYSLIVKFLPEKTFVIFRNTVDTKNKHLLSARLSFTFDPADAKKYSMILYNQYIPSIDYLRKNEPSVTYDVAFLGRGKGRRYMLEKLRKILINKRFLIDLVDNNYSYNEYIIRQYSGKVIIEIGKEGQCGPSMRAVEALSLERKIITNNKTLKETLRFAAKNIFLIEESTSRESLVNFIEAGFSPIPEVDLRRFESRYVLSEILGIVKRKILHAPNI